MKAFLTQNQKETLQKEHKRVKKKKQADRIKAVLLLDDGYSVQEIATILLIHKDTVRTYYEEYQKGALDKLLTDNYKGGVGKLTSDQEQELKEHVAATLYLSAKEIVAHVKKVYGVTYTERGMQGLLHRLGFVFKKPKRVPSKADKEKQQEFIAKYTTIKEEKDKDDRIWFIDGVHPRHNALLGYGWILKGKDKQIKANTGRKGLNINGALNIEDYQVITREDERINAQSTLQLIQQIEAQQTKGKIYLIADNARYNYAKTVREYIEQNERIEMLYLPPYSPNLNIIERLWKLFKKVVLYNKYYEKYEQFVAATRNFFDQVTVLYRAEMETLLTDKFQVIAV